MFVLEPDIASPEATRTQYNNKNFLCRNQTREGNLQISKMLVSALVNR